MYMYENRCIPTIKPINMKVNNSNELIITLPKQLTLLNGKKWHLLICSKMPEIEGIGDVYFKIGKTKLPAINGIGNTLKSDGLRSRRRYTLTYGWDEPHMLVCGTLESAFIPVSAIYQDEPCAQTES